MTAPYRQIGTMPDGTPLYVEANVTGSNPPKRGRPKLQPRSTHIPKDYRAHAPRTAPAYNDTINAERALEAVGYGNAAYEIMSFDNGTLVSLALVDGRELGVWLDQGMVQAMMEMKIKSCSRAWTGVSEKRGPAISGETMDKFLQSLKDDE